MGQTYYTDKMVMHKLVQGLKDAAIAKNVMEEYATNDNLHNRFTLKKLKSSLRLERERKRSMADLTRAQEEPLLTRNKLSNYHKGKSLELKKKQGQPEK